MKKKKPVTKTVWGDEVVELLSSLPRTRVNPEGPYTHEDRRRDFIATFSNDTGRRVLDQIVQICDPIPKVEDADKPGTMAFKLGMRRVLAEIQLCIAGKPRVVIQTEPPKKEELNVNG